VKQFCSLGNRRKFSLSVPNCLGKLTTEPHVTARVGYTPASTFESHRIKFRS